MKWRAALAGLLVVSAGAAAYFGFFFFRDNFTTHYPLKVISARSYRALEIPYWNFHAAGGQPLAGNPNALTFYPDNLLYLVLSAHVAFNLHFLIHVAAGFLAVRALCLARGSSKYAAHFAATVYLLSGLVVSATVFYNLIVAIAALPLALYGVERRSARLLGCAFGLMLLAAEPVTLFAATLTVAIVAAGKMTIRSLVVAALFAAVIGAPQIIAFSEIAGELERVAGNSPRTVLTTALTPTRIAELFLWPFSGFLNDPSEMAVRGRLFSTIFLGVIAIPALARKSRYVAVAGVMLFLAAANNPVVEAAIERFEWIRVGRFPEKFVIPLVVALVVLIADYFDRTRFRRAWVAVTLIPLLWTAARALPIDWYSYYRVEPLAPRRVYIEPHRRGGSVPAREEYRARVRDLDPLFGAVAGLRYVLDRSPDGMYALLTRGARERFVAVGPATRMRYLQLAAAQVPLAVPWAMVVPRTLPARSIDEAVALVEHPAFDPHRAAVAPMSMLSAPARVLDYRERGQTIEIDVEAAGPALVMVNQTYFAAWRATMDGEELETMPLNVDRMGVVVPRSGRVVLRFGRNRIAVAGSWIASLLLLAFTPFAQRVEQLDRRAGEIERAGDEE